jgi:hypothetical protein
MQKLNEKYSLMDFNEKRVSLWVTWSTPYQHGSHKKVGEERKIDISYHD